MRSACQTIWFASIAAAMPTVAHHNSGTDPDRMVTIEGVVTRAIWRNPHSYFFIETTDESGRRVEWEIESNPPSLLARLGWAEDSVQVGDLVTVRANPHRDPSRTVGYGRSLAKYDGTVLAMARGYDGLSRDIASTSEIWGTWDGLFDRGVYFGLFTAADMPLTEQGKTASANFDVNADPWNDCIPIVSPRSIGEPDLKMIEQQGNTIMIRGVLGVERTVHMDGRGHPEDGERTLQGHSIGRWEGDVLVVDTRLFANNRWGNGRGVPSGPQKHVVERYELSDNGTSLSVHFVLEDPEYLAEPVSGTFRWTYAPHIEWVTAPCDPESAKFHINVDN